MAYDRIELEKVSFNLVISINLYGEEIIVRDLETGKILERYKGYLNRMPDGTAWLMTE